VELTDKEKLSRLKSSQDNPRHPWRGEVLEWIIERCEKAERYEQALKEIANEGAPRLWFTKIARQALKEASE
jgi:hypothetical protein